ncbi:hypothetical protein ACN9JU_04905 [Aliarcobacter butzleri]|uniref:hypothetical protein n=1 Tax=Aliarcobacter butzleri TaxID=28197 RepID=UPI001EDDE6E5|nr:hypothetical protein [Aliarcobacter butzleri]MCG3673902.1 hypothetical protein [Aliarcobacter butzleri]MCT7551486.1 hypothetical protein [Aliarcobacter butzleri]MCT7562891.1 hypothetical protein [Aliarcobacter butzleri]MCT7572012.1 hypothetical protein [Aliarcobacter butzleri]MCT7576235.1 hypothetical protein [Aliarcobacter butzleri]
MQENELKAFIKENSPLIYEYINSELLKDIGVMSSDFFVRLIDEFFKKEKRIYQENITADTLGYYLICEVLGEAKQAFPFFRKDTLCLDEIFKEAKVYFNHVKFSTKDDIFTISLVQTKAGVSTLDEEIIKFSKDFPMKISGLQEFIEKQTL